MPKPDPIVVQIDRDLEDLVPLFLAQRKADLATLSAAIPAGDLEAIRRAGHGMAGAGASYGLDHFSMLGEQLVTAARAGDAAAVGRLKQELEDYMARLVVNFV